MAHNEPWTVEDDRTLASVAYFPALRAERAGEHYVKAHLLDDAARELRRTHHACKRRCYCISEVLRDEGLPFVGGWRPPAHVRLTANTYNQTTTIRDAVVVDARHEFG